MAHHFSGTYRFAYGGNYHQYLIDSGMPREIALQSQLTWPPTLDIEVRGKNIMIISPYCNFKYNSAILLGEEVRKGMKPTSNIELTWKEKATMEGNKLNITMTEYQLNTEPYDICEEENKTFELYDNSVLVLTFTRPHRGTSTNAYYNKVPKRKKQCVLL